MPHPFHGIGQRIADHSIIIDNENFCHLFYSLMKNMIMGEDGATRLKTENHTDFRYLIGCVSFVKIYKKRQ